MVKSTVPLQNRTRSVELSISGEDAIDLSTRIILFVMCAGYVGTKGGKEIVRHIGAVVSVVRQN